MTMWSKAAIVEELLGSEAMDQLFFLKIKETIDLFFTDYSSLKEKHLRGELIGVGHQDMLDNEADILALERVYVCFSGDWDYVSVITGEKVYYA